MNTLVAGEDLFGTEFSAVFKRTKAERAYRDSDHDKSGDE